MKMNDLALGFLVLMGAIAILISAQGFASIPGQEYGAGTMPTAIGLFGTGLGLWIMAKPIVAGERMPRAWLDPWARSWRTLLAVFAALAAVILYIFLAKPVGYLPVAFVLMAALMLVRRVPWPIALVVSLVAAILIQQAFGRALLVPIPRSPFLGFMW